MLSLSSVKRFLAASPTSLALMLAVIMGSIVGYFSSPTGEWLGNKVDYTLLLLVSFLFFGVRFSALLQAAKNLRILTIAIVANFILVPLIGYGVASLFLSQQPLLMVGLVIYFMSPCTDWFLSFTRLAKGNVALGSVLIPINMITQLLLYPLFLQWFTQNSVQVEAGIISTTLMQWFLMPLLVAVIVHQLLKRLASNDQFKRILAVADNTTTWLTALLVLQIFAGNISVVVAHFPDFAWILIAVFLFFMLTFLLGEVISWVFRLQHPEHALLTMTIAARNAPLMLAVTMVALPGQPLIYAALIIGMLIEFPHLTALRRILLVPREHRPYQLSSNESTKAL